MRHSIVSILLALTFLLWSGGSARADVVQQRFLNTTMNRQETSSWCWAATSTSAMAYHGTYTSQCRFVAAGTSGDPNGSCPADMGGTTGTMVRGFGVWSFGSAGYTGSKSFSDLKTQINSVGPLAAGWRFFEGSTATGGHVVLINGWRETTFDFTTTPYYEVRYMNPTDGQYYVESFTTFTESTRNVGGQAVSSKWQEGVWYIFK
jgi:hypothetical protein